jgi:uncharacterized membrane protein
MKKNFLDYLFICHKIPARSFFYKGKQFPICSRCTGILIGYIIGIILLVLTIFWPFFLLKPLIVLILLIPLVLDGMIQYFTKYESNNIKRLITGILAGISIIFVIYYLAGFGYKLGKSCGEYILYFRFFYNFIL